MSLVEVKEPLVLLNDELCWFILKSPDFSNHQDFHVILTDLSDPVLQALKGFFLLIKKCSKIDRQTSVCLTIDFSKVAKGKCADVYKSLLQNVGSEVTELRLSGMDDCSYTNNVIHPFSVSNPTLFSTLSLPHLHTIRISNLGWQENIMWLSYFLNAANNLKQLHIGPFDDLYIQGLGKWEEDGYSLLLPSAKFGSKNEVRINQLQLLGQCVNFEEMSQAQLFIKGLWLSTFNSRIFRSNFRKNWDGKAEAEMGIGITLPTKIQIQSKAHEQCYDNMVDALCTTPSLVVLSGLGYFTLDPKLSSPFHALEKLEVKSGPTWLLDNLENFPSLKHLVWTPIWIPEKGNHHQHYDIQPNNTTEDLRPQIVHSLKNLEIFRLAHDWKTSQSLPENAFQVVQLLSSSFPRLKIFSCEVSEIQHVSTLLEHFPQVKEFHFNKYVPITQIRPQMAPQLPKGKSWPAPKIQQSSQPEVSYKLENFREKITSFKSQVEKFQNTCSKDVERKIKIGAFIYDESMQMLVNGRCRHGIDLNLPEICSTISNLNLSEIVIPFPHQLGAGQILEAIKSSGPKDLEHVHFQIMKLFNSSNPNSYDGIPQQVIDSYKPFFLVTSDLEPGKNNLNCSSLAKDFWE